MSFSHGSAAADNSKTVPVSCQNDRAPNLNNTDPKSHATIITIVQVLLESSNEKSSSEKKNCVLDYQDQQVQPWQKLDLPPSKGYPELCSSPTLDFWSRKACPDFPSSPTQDSRLRKACPDFPSSPTQDSRLRKACPDFPSSPTRDSLPIRAYRDSPSRLSRVVEESESFAKREGSSIVPPPRPDLFHCNTPGTSSTSSTSSRDSVDEKPLFKQRTPSAVIKANAKKATKRRSLCSLILYPLKKIRDAYVRCMMSIDGAGDFAGMVQGGHIVSTGAYFAQSPPSKTDPMNYG